MDQCRGQNGKVEPALEIPELTKKIGPKYLPEHNSGLTKVTKNMQQKTQSYTKRDNNDNNNLLEITRNEGPTIETNHTTTILTINSRI